MRSISLLLMIGTLCMACSSLPQLYPGNGSAGPSNRTCLNNFPGGKWQFLHSIEATMPGGKHAFVMGVTVISSDDRSIRCVILTIEGLVVFDAAYNRRIEIKRAIPPFDSIDFAKELLKDIQLIFFKPVGPLIASGFLENGSSVCRYQISEGRTIDIITHIDHSWEIRQFSPDFQRRRTVKGLPDSKGRIARQPGIVSRIELTAHGSPKYELNLDLVEAVELIE
ncbi:hypothetical protein ACFL0M_02565 [Thermodesulfobacteriota bacterium]